MNRRRLLLAALLPCLAAATLAAPPATPAEVRRQVLLTRLRGQTPVVVFDLDDTLFVAGSRTRTILEHYALVRRPDLLERIRSLDYLSMPYLVTDTLDSVGIRDRATHEEVKAFWMARFFDDYWPVVDVPMKGGVDYVSSLHRRGAHVVYLTGRNEPNMGRATRRSLALAGYPAEGERVHYFLKPAFDIPDETFKADALRSIGALGTLVATFENEPGNARLMMEAFEDGGHFLVGDRHNPSAPEAHPALVRIEDFRGH